MGKAQEEYLIRSGFEAMDFDRVTAMLANSYWAPGIGRAEVLKSAEHSAVLVGAFTADGTQVGYARAISDTVRFAYIMDVIVDEAHRRQGLGQRLVQAILAQEALADVYQWLLITKDAHGVYQKLGFAPTARPDDWMEIRLPRPQR